MIDKIQKKVLACMPRTKTLSNGGFGFGVPGLVDKNGEQLYTGDEVEYFHPGIMHEYSRGIICFSIAGGFYIEVLEGDRGLLESALYRNECEKIGNVFVEV